MRKISKKGTKGKRYRDLSGLRFGKLLVLSRDFAVEHKRPYYLCRCDCGNEVVTCGTSLTRKRGNSLSCGCWRSESKRLGYGVSSMNMLISAYKRGAKTRGLVFELSREQFFNLTQKECFYCGKPPSSVIEKLRGWGKCIYNGIDRLDNNVGYLAENCVPCCFVCNRMKSTLEKEEFIEHIRRIYNHLKDEKDGER